MITSKLTSKAQTTIPQPVRAGLKREDLKPGTPVVVRINPNRSGWGKQVRVLDVTELG